MTKYFLAFTLLLVSLFSFSQKNTASVVDSIKILDSDSSIYMEVDSLASFPGGTSAWATYAKSNFDFSTLRNARGKEMRIIIRFIVAKDGSLSNFKKETRYGSGLEDETIRILKQSPKWIPAILNGKNVSSYVEQSMSFFSVSH